jgi:hypothetical protein
MTRFDRLPGTRDFYPDEMRVRRWIEDRWREVALRYGFEEYDAPVIEPLELFTDKSGEEIVEQIYSFVDRGSPPEARGCPNRSSGFRSRDCFAMSARNAVASESFGSSIWTSSASQVSKPMPRSWPLASMPYAHAV